MLSGHARLKLRHVKTFKFYSRRVGHFALATLAASSLYAQASVGTDFFEKEIRPVFVAKCYGCHSSKLKSPMGGLALDTKVGLKTKAGAWVNDMPYRLDAPIAFKEIRAIDPGRDAHAGGIIGDCVKTTYRVSDYRR